jgi:hypothetical protein
LYFYFILPNALGINFDRKGSKLFWIEQKNGKLFAIYWFSGRRFAPIV